MKAGRLGSTVRVMGNHCGMKCYDRVCAVEGMLGGLEWRMGGRLRRDSSHSKGEVVSTHPRAKDGENGGTVKKSGEWPQWGSPERGGTQGKERVPPLGSRGPHQSSSQAVPLSHGGGAFPRWVSLISIPSQPNQNLRVGQ